MSFKSSGDEQSEDGELRQSPLLNRKKNDIMDFSLSEEDPDTMDGLDIKPPQAHAPGQSSRSKRRDHERHHKHPDRHREERHAHRSKHRDRKERDAHYLREKERYYKEKANYEASMYNQEIQYMTERAHRERKEESSTRRHSERKHEEKKRESREGRLSDGRHQREKYEDDRRSAGDKTLNDLRARLLSKRTSTKSEDEYFHIEKELSMSRKYREEESMDTLLQGEAGMYVKDIINISSGDDSRRHRSVAHRDDDKLTEEERIEQELRREKLLEAEREMARQKELRERRHLEKQKRKLEDDLSAHKRARVEDHIVLSDNTDSDEAEPVSDYHENDSANESKDSGSERSSAHSRSHSSERDSARSRTKSRSRSPSRSRSRSASASYRSGEKSRSTSPIDNGNINSNEYEERRFIHEVPDEEMEKTEGEKETIEKPMEKEEEVKTEVKKIDDDLPPYFPAIQGCRSVEEFQCLNRIEEGTYGVVYRARDKRTDDIVALKRLKMENEKEGFPITSLREINTLLKGQHPNIVTVREIVVGSNMDKIFIVMDYVEHDLKSLMETMRHKQQTFTAGEVKCILMQLLKAVAHLHDNWILHRDLKTSNLLLSHKGILKVGDFGLAREYGSPLKPYTSIVVTLWYRAPELLLCVKEYSTPIDVWSVGCIFAELLLMNALFPGKAEVAQLNLIFKLLGTPNEMIWPGYKKLPAVMKMKFTEYPVSNLRNKFPTISESGLNLLKSFLTYDPAQRVTAEDALTHQYFTEVPLPIDPAMFPTWPAKSELGHRKALAASPKPPRGGPDLKQRDEVADDGYGFRIGISAADSRRLQMGGGFNLKF